MDTRRDFLKKAALLSGSAALMNVLPPSIQRALAINPDAGSTFYDAEHIVFLMQENRSFDHEFGTLQGVRGFNDPRAIELPNRNKVWLQSNKEGHTYAPFLMNVKDTKVAWMGSIPHNWANQTDARNMGKYNRWLDVKRSGNKAYADMPLTLGYCNRNDFPFYYSLADAFTVCDQSFCSSITGTHSNRYYWMTGTIREMNEPAAKAHVWNHFNNEKLAWKTYPERLEESGVSWKIYQNEIGGSSLMGEGSQWLGNFGTNVMEYFDQYNVMLHPDSIAALEEKRENIIKQIGVLEKQPADDVPTLKLAAAKKLLAKIESDQLKYNLDNYNKLSAHQKSIMEKAFSTNKNDPDYHELTPLKYSDDGVERELNIPKGDILHQFRHDVESGNLPTVSWLMSPANFSDHPSAPWFGPLYVSEVMDILTKNPEIWKKTIFVLTYDENDGYFDHVPPFVVPSPYKAGTGKVSESLDTKMDFATKDQQTNPSASEASLREAPIGLGFRVPMVIASPWTRGGFVCSEVFDHTSSIQFVENFLEKKMKKKVREENITKWRRTICGDLTSAFRPYNDEKTIKPAFLEKDQFIESIHQSKFKQEPDNFKKLSSDEITLFNTDPFNSPYFPKQEKGVRLANALPYELYTDGHFDNTENKFSIKFKAGNAVFGERAKGSPFCVYAVNPYMQEEMRNWDYTAVAGDTISDEWKLDDFKDGNYHLRVYGPNGFYREFSGNNKNPLLRIDLAYERSRLNPLKLTGNVSISITNNDSKEHTLEIIDNSYKTGTQKKKLAPKNTATIVVNSTKSYNWYDVSIKINGYDQFEERFAGRVETGAITKTDPLMGRII